MLLDLILATPRLDRFRTAELPEFRELETRRGRYFVAWSPAHVKALLEQEDITVRDLAVEDRSTLQSLTRDLFLLGLEDELATQEESRITRFARELMHQAR